MSMGCGDYRDLIERFNKLESSRERAIIRQDDAGYINKLNEANKAIQVFPEEASVYIARALIYMKAGRYKQAIKDCNAAIEIDSMDAMNYLARGYAYAGLDLTMQALSDFTMATFIDPLDSVAYIGKAQMNMRLEWYDEVIKDCNIAINLTKNSTDEMDIEHFNMAREMFDTAIRLRD